MSIPRAKELRRTYGFDEVSIVPGQVTINPGQANIEFSVNGITLSAPIITAAMDAIVSPEFAAKFDQLGGPGFIWIGTQDGLNRYDGYEFKVYKHDPDDENSLSENIITALHQDRDGMLWIGTQKGGLNLFDPVAGSFEHFSHDDEDQDLARRSDASIRFSVPIVGLRGYVPTSACR